MIQTFDNIQNTHHTTSLFFPMFDKALFRGRLGALSRWAEGFRLA